MSKGMKILFGLSLALNLLFVGLAGGAMWKYRSFTHHDNKAFYIAGKLVQDLPQARQKVLLSGFVDLKDKLAQVKAKHPVNWRLVMDTLAKEPFDAKALRSHLEALHAKRYERKLLVADHFIAMLKKMTLQERQALRESRFFKKMIRRGGRYRH